MVETGDSLFILADKEEAFNHRRIDYFQHSICSTVMSTANASRVLLFTLSACIALSTIPSENIGVIYIHLTLFHHAIKTRQSW